MNILKIGLVLLTGAGFGFGVDKLSDTDITESNGDNYYEHMYDEHEDENYFFGHMYGGCLDNDGDFLEHMLASLTDEELLIVEEKIDQLLLEYSIVLEELNDDYDVRYDFMIDIMEFLDENEIYYHNNREFGHHTDGDDWYRGMGMH